MAQTEEFTSVDKIAKPVDLGTNWIIWLWRMIIINLLNIPRDLKNLFLLLKLRIALKGFIRNNITVPALFSQVVARNPNKVCFHFEDRKITFSEMEDLTNKIANVFHGMGFKKGDVVALFMESRPEYVAVWLGLSKLGVCTALINFNLRDKPLLHCIDVAQAKALVVGSELVPAVEDINDSLNSEIKILHYGMAELLSAVIPMESLDKLINNASSYSPPSHPDIKITDKLLYIYTSGTTGLPKAAIISHNRVLMAGYGMGVLLNIAEDDVVYTALPLYHTSGGVITIGMALLYGATIAIRKKFSASNFWEDCIKYKCTLAQYIGEMCRYVLSQPPGPQDVNHNVHTIFGNGLRPQIWNTFTDRFNLPCVREFYGATEGNVLIANMENRVGAVGYIPWYSFANFLFPITLIRVDEGTGLPLRGKDGLCIRCLPGEAGEIVGKIVSNDPMRDFSGYVDKKATNKKLVNDVMRKGDVAFLSGDILVMDERGYLYFKDRTGDTFRWKGENVSTAEVEAVISNLVNFRDSCVYGVEIPGCEGRAGMAAIVDPTNSVDIETLRLGISKSLPSYARPIFIRIKTSIKMTGTYKIQKIDLVKEGFDPNISDDTIYFLDSRKNQFIKLDNELYNNIINQKIKL